MAIIKTYPLKNNYYGPDRLILSDMQPDDQGVVHGTTKSLTLSSLKSFIGTGSDSFTLVVDRTSGAATFDTNTKILNIPNYSVGNVDGSGTANRIPRWTDSNTLGDSQIEQNSTSIGVGTTLGTATGSLEVYNGVLNNQLFVTCPDTSQAAINFGGTSAKTKGRINYSDNSDVMMFHTNSSEKMRILSNGNVGIGTQDPQYNLDVNSDLRAKGITSSATHTVTIEATAGWYRLMQWGGSSRGGAIVKLSTTGGNTAPTTYVINAYKTYGDPASSNTLKLEQYGNGGYITKARIATDSVTNVTYVEIYNTITSANYTMEVYHDSLLGFDSLTSVLTGTLVQGPNSVSQDELPFVYEGTTTEKSSSELVTLIGDGTNDGKLRFNCSANSHYVEIEGPTHSGGSSYSLKLPNTLPSVSNQILEANALGVLSWIPTPSGGGGGGGTVTSVGLTMPPAFSVGNSPITGSGSISVGVTGGSAGEFLAYNGQWATPAGSYTSWTLQADDNVNRTIVNGATVDIQGGTGITTTTINPTGTLYVVSAALDAATSSTRGGIKIGYTETGKNYPVELSSEQAYVNVPWTDTVYTLPEATATARGGIELFSNTTQTTAANSVTTTASRTYGIQLNAANQAVVNVPWVGGGTGSPAGVANNVQFSDGTSFSADVNFNWDSSSNKLILGKDSTPQFQEGILRLLGDGQGGTAGTIEFQSAQGKSGGAAATVKLQGPVSGVTQEILLPDALPTANTQVLGIDTIVGTKVTTQWETPSTGTTYTAGTGITINSGNVISNTDLGSSQFIYKNFAGSTGGTATASSNNDTLTIAAGTGITTARSGNTITVAATGSGSYDDGFIPLDIYQATSPIGGNDGDFSFIRQTQSYNSSTINRISFFVQSIGVNPEIRFALFDGANVKNGVGTCRVNASSSSLTAGIINEMALTDGEGTTINYTCVPGKNLVLFFAIRNCVIAGSAALSDAGLGHQDESYVSLPSVDDSLSTTKTAIGTDPNNKIAACHFFKT